MNISGTATMHAPPGAVWAALTDPVVLAAAIPGCERLELAAPRHWRFALTTGVASMQGAITGDATTTGRRQASSLTVSARGAGGPGTVSATIRFQLTAAPADSTELSYDADATVSGQLAGVGQRMLASAAARMADQFVTALDQSLTSNAVDSAGPAGPARVSGRQPAKAATGSFLPGIVAGAIAGAVAGFMAGRLIARRGR